MTPRGPRVLHLTRDLPPRARGGISTAVGGLVAAAVARGVPTAVLSFDGWRPRRAGAGVQRDDAGGVAVLRLEGPAGLAAARAFAAEWAPQLVVVHDPLLWSVGAKLAVEAGAGTAHVVQVVHAALSAARSLAEPTGSERAQAEALREADAVWLPSEAARELLAPHDPVAADRAVVLPLGLGPPGVGGAEARAEGLPVGCEPPMVGAAEARAGVLCVGRFDVLKGTRDLLDAVALLAPRHPDLRAALLGGLPESPSHERRWRRRWEEEAPPAARAALRFLPWAEPDAVAAAQAQAAVVVAPSRLETFGLAALEAMAAGAALVAASIPAHRELVDDGVDGILVPAARPDALADAVESLLLDQARAERLGAAARARAAAATWEARIGPWIAAFRGAAR